MSFGDSLFRPVSIRQLEPDLPEHSPECRVIQREPNSVEPSPLYDLNLDIPLETFDDLRTVLALWQILQQSHPQDSWDTLDLKMRDRGGERNVGRPPDWLDPNWSFATKLGQVPAVLVPAGDGGIEELGSPEEAIVPTLVVDPSDRN